MLDTKELFAWLTARPEISDTQIGALGISLGGGAVWNATVAGVPFKAIVPVITWTNLATALAPQGLSKSGLVQLLASLVPQSRWDPDLLAAQSSLVTSTNMGTVTALASTRSPLQQLSSVTTPTLLIQGRRDFLFDVDQALAAYKLLKGPKRLYLGDLGHAPGISPATAPDAAIYWGEAVKWFDRYLKGAAASLPPSVVELGHDPYDGKTTTYRSAGPATKTISVALPGSTTMSGATGKVVRSVRVTGGPHETFGDSTVTVALLRREELGPPRRRARDQRESEPDQRGRREDQRRERHRDDQADERGRAHSRGQEARRLSQLDVARAGACGTRSTSPRCSRTRRSRSDVRRYASPC